MKNEIKGRLYIVFAAAIFGLMPLGASFAYQGGSNALQLVFTRLFLPLPFFYALVKWKKESLSITRKQFFQIQFLAFSFCLTPITLYMSYYYMDSGVATTLHFMYPLFVILGCLLFYKEMPTTKVWICLGLTIMGLLLAMPRGGAQGLGVFYSIFSALTFSVYVIYLSKSGLGILGSMSLLFHIALAGSLQTAVMITFLRQWSAMSLQGWIASFVFAMVVSLGGALSFQKGTLLIGPQKASIFSTLEPLVSIVVGVLLLGDKLSLGSGVGMFLILLSSLLLTKD